MTMRDVAEAVGVSQASVSYAYNRPDKLSESQRTRIFAAAAELGYTGPDPAARGLRTGKVGALGLILTDSLSYAFHDPGASLLLRGISEVGELAQVALTLLPAPLETVPTPASSGAPLLGLVDGFMIYAMPDRHPVVQSVLSRGLPVVVIDGPAVPGHSLVGIDDHGAAREAATHLLDLGHRRLGVLVSRLAADGRTGPVTATRLSRARDRVMKARVQGYLEAARERGIAQPVVHEAGGFGYPQARAAAEKLLDAEAVTAVLAATDVLALAVLDAARERGLRVPEQLSVIGFDDLPAAEAAELTTVRQSLSAKGTHAAQLLLAAVNGATDHPNVTLPTELVIRRSTAQPS